MELAIVLVIAAQVMFVAKLWALERRQGVLVKASTAMSTAIQQLQQLQLIYINNLPASKEAEALLKNAKQAMDGEKWN